MPTAENMYDFCVRYGFGHGVSRGWGIKHFSVIEKNLMSNEKPQMCFIGLHNYISLTKHDNNFAYCVTDKRILMGQKKLIGEVFQSVLFDRINDITMTTGILLGILTIDTMNEKFNVAVDKHTILNINERIHSVLERVKRKDSSNAAPASMTISNQETYVSAADEILKLKNLVDMGIITQEEFDKKKKQLLEI